MIHNCQEIFRFFFGHFRSRRVEAVAACAQKKEIERHGTRNRRPISLGTLGSLDLISGEADRRSDLTTTVINRPRNASDFSHKIVKSLSGAHARRVRGRPRESLEL